MPSVGVAGASLRYELSGTGPVVVALDGIQSTVETSCYGQLPGLGAEVTLLLGDQPGGGSSSVAGRLSIAAAAECWIAAMDDAGVDRAPVFGNSMGGLVAMQMASAYPDRVERLALSSTTAACDRVLHEFLTLGVDILRDHGPRAWTVYATLTASSSTNLHDDLMQQALAAVPDLDVHGYAAQVAAVLEFDMRERLAGLTQPTLVIGGSQDRTTRPWMVRDVADRISGARLEIVPDAGHTLALDAPERFAELLLASLR